MRPYTVKNLSGTDSVQYLPTNPPGPQGSIAPGATQSVSGVHIAHYTRDSADQPTDIEVNNPDPHDSMQWTTGGPRQSITPGATVTISLPALPGEILIYA